ncbi:MAG: FecR domain-containing protein, partial [Candidatus Binatia bacterium]
MLRATLTAFTALFLAFVATPVFAQDAGKVVSLEGAVEIGRAGTFTQAAVASGVRSGDTIRTGNPGRVRILFADDSVLNLGDNTTLVIDETVFDASKGAATTMMHLLGGKVRALVSEYYSGNQGSYQIETTTAVSGVRGTEFVVAYDNQKRFTEVLGLGGLVAVHGTIDRKNRGVLVHANEITEIAFGKYPTPPRQIGKDDERYLRLMEGLDLPGSGMPESLLLEDPAFGGEAVP